MCSINDCHPGDHKPSCPEPLRPQPPKRRIKLIEVVGAVALFIAYVLGVYYGVNHAH
jgi:hypothetical protein